MKISIVYITNAKSLSTLNKCIYSALFADEVVIVGNTKSIEYAERNIIKIEASDLANDGMISKMRNIGSDIATGDIIINADDDIFFPPMFKTKLMRFINKNRNINSFTTKVIGVNGSRYWDRPVHDEKNGDSYMIDYNEYHPELYYSGAFLVRTKSFSNKYKWNNALKYYEKEDIEFSGRIKADGHSINIDPKNYVIHVDRNYTSYINHIGRLVCDKISSFTIDQIQEKELREIKCVLNMDNE